MKRHFKDVGYFEIKDEWRDAPIELIAHTANDGDIYFHLQRYELEDLAYKICKQFAIDLKRAQGRRDIFK